MPVTGQNFVYTGGTSTYLRGSTVVTAPYVAMLDPVSALNATNGAPPAGTGVASGFLNNSAQAIDRVVFDLSLTSVPPAIGAAFATFGRYVGGFARNGAMAFTMTGTTPVTVDFSNTAAAIGVTASAQGDTTVTTMNALIVINASATASTVVMAPGGSNPLTFPHALAGTTPTISLLAGDIHCQYAVVGKTVDGTHKTLLFTPTAGGTILIAFGGA